jgi:NAD(P)-dependent dehydrogenase (short-subunit alcohol dehydrogenase family)
VTLAAAADSVAAAAGERGLAGLVNNAGIVVAGPLEHVALDDLRRQFEVNVLGAVAAMQSFLPLLRRGPGRIVNVSSIAGIVALPFMGPYSASKFALAALSESVRVELRSTGVRVAVIEAGAIRTELWDRSFEAADARVAALSAEARSHYGAAYAGGRTTLARVGRRATPARAVARAVEHALAARRPRRRYRVGRGSTLVWACSFLPGGVRDRLLALYSGG